jgi:hypothetical protein
MKKISLLTCSAMLSQCAAAATGYYLVPVYSVEGQTSIDYKYWNAKSSGTPNLGAPEIGVGYGVTSRWYTEVSGSYRQSAPQGTQFNGLNWQNDVLLTQGEYPFDLAIHTNVEQYADRGYGIEFGPALQTNVGRTQLNANVFFQRDYKTGKTSPMLMTYQWQIRQHWKPLLNFGVQGFGELGQWDNWDDSSRQSHRIGPALFGSWFIGKRRGESVPRELRYEAAYLIGKNSGRNAKSFTMRVQYAF